ncbi:MAG TPA: hypothetical protein VHZ74_04690 [Bryobacteraceae bacterium]|jgi:hypothetical protein|nr:hypothetical protein [Bryobacteraceae bacterium]
MAGGALTTLSTLQCPHGGSVIIASSNTKVQAGGGFAATMNDVFSVAGCPFMIPATPPIPSPCLTVQWLVGDLRILINNQPGLSQSSVGLCLNAQQIPQGPVVIAATQPQVSSQ